MSSANMSPSGFSTLTASNSMNFSRFASVSITFFEFMGNTPSLGNAKLVGLRCHSRQCFPPPCGSKRLRYNPTVTSKKGVIGFDSLKRYRGMKPQRHHSLAAFSICAPVLAAQVGGAQAPAGFAPRFASLSTRLSRRLCLTADATVVLTNQLERIMPKSPAKRTSVRVAIINGQPTVNSRNIAETFGKHHGNLIQRIKQMDCSDEFRCSNFSEHPYVNAQNGQTYTEYLITRDGFSFLCMGFTGAKAAQWKERYISTFNQMAEQLVNPVPSLINRRWLVGFDYMGKECIQPVAMDAAVLSPSNPDHVAAFLLEMVPQSLLTEALATLTGRIARVLNQTIKAKQSKTALM